MIKLGFAITGSFCTHKKILEEMEKLVLKGYDILPILSDNSFKTDTRFGEAKEFIEKVEKICGKKVVHTITEAEKIGPNNLIDILVVAPCTGNTLAKLANAITDNAVTMCAKSHVRNNKPVVIGISSNDAMGLNFKNLALLFNSKNFFFIPFSQDDSAKKPHSLVAKWEKTEDTILDALKGKQIQPVIE